MSKRATHNIALTIETGVRADNIPDKVTRALRAGGFKGPVRAHIVIARSPEDQVSDALSILQGDYYRNTIGGLVACFRDAAQSGEIEDQDSAETWIHETIDGHHDVIYTACAQTVCLVSQNDGAYIDNFGTEGLCEDGAISWSRLAYAAMEADLREALDNDGVDLDAPETYKGSTETE